MGDGERGFWDKAILRRMTTTINEVLALSEPVNPGRYRRYLEGLKPATLAARLHNLKKSAGRRGRPMGIQRRTLAQVAS